MQVSLFASSVRPKLYESFFKSLERTSVEYEIIFAGNCKVDEWANELKYAPTQFQYIRTQNIKPAQCYEIARKACKGEVVIWVADDCEFPNDIIGKAYQYWKQQNNEKLILSIQTIESGYPDGKMIYFDMRNHTFFGFRKQSPLMAPLGMMSRQYLDELGGLDRRYICGQYENDIVMRAYADGGEVQIFGDKENNIVIDHWKKSKICNEGAFLKRPFATGYEKDRRILEYSWSKNGIVTLDRYDDFEPYEDKDLLNKSQSNKGQWR